VERGEMEGAGGVEWGANSATGRSTGEESAQVTHRRLKMSGRGRGHEGMVTKAPAAAFGPASEFVSKKGRSEVVHVLMTAGVFACVCVCVCV